MPSIPKETFTFGSFQLIVPDRVLTLGGEPVSLKPRAVEVLAVLAAHANEMVAKDDLMRIVWPNTFVEDGNLAVHISALRKLLAGAGSPVEIETIPRRGYRLVGEVHLNGADPLQATEPSDVSTVVNHDRRQSDSRVKRL